jgi:threonine dehydratase
VLPGPQDVAAAAARIADHIRVTPVLRLELGGLDLWLKLEQVQVTGSFKARGATNAVRSIDPAPRAVVSASGGNHGLGVAYAASTIGAEATIVVPLAVPDAKARRLAAAGATVIRHGDHYDDAEAHARHLAEEHGLPYVHAFGDAAVIAGQGTVAREVLATTDADAIVVAVGGGGLLAGCVAATRGTGMRVIGAEPQGIPTVTAALAAGEPVDVAIDSVTASALGARRTAPLTLELARLADDVVLVDDAAILAARDLLWDRCRLAVEPAAAAGLAVVLAGHVAAERPCVVLCGANIEWRPDDPA